MSGTFSLGDPIGALLSVLENGRFPVDKFVYLFIIATKQGSFWLLGEALNVNSMIVSGLAFSDFAYNYLLGEGLSCAWQTSVPATQGTPRVGKL